MDNPKTEFLLALGRFVVCFSKLQNILQEGIYVLSTKIQESNDAVCRRFMHEATINQLQNVFLTLATEYGSKCEHVDQGQFVCLRGCISRKLDELKQTRNRIMHSVWDEKFWEGCPGNHLYRMIYHKNKDYRFNLDCVEYDWPSLDNYSRTALSLENFIHDFLICIADGGSDPSKSFASYFEFDGNKARFPRSRDIERYRNIDSYI